MDQDTYRKNRKVFFLYATTITCIIVGLFLHYEKMQFISEQVSQILAVLFILASYFLLLRIASRLKQKEIHGLGAIAWASLLLFGTGNTSRIAGGTWLSILHSISIIVLIYFLVDGIIRFSVSLIVRIKTSAISEEKTIDSIDTVVAIITSLAAIIISIVEIC